MRVILVRTLLLTLSISALWIFAGSLLSSILDRAFTVVETTLPMGVFELSADQFVIGAKKWLLTDAVHVQRNARGDVALTSDGRTFVFGPMTSGRTESPGAYYRFGPEVGDSVTFVARRSWLAWPTPFRFSIMNAPMTTWRRHAYRRLRWSKPTGAAIELVWRDEQGFFARAGWADDNLQRAPTVTITTNP